MSSQRQPADAPFDSNASALEPGFFVGNGRFTLARLLGRGGMGVVWLARDESLREDVALKFLPPEIRHDAVALDDLRRETARARRLTHPNIIRIHDLYKDDREAFISMEYIDGPNLGDLRLEQPSRVFTWEFLEPLVKQLCEALDYAHGEKVVHRDLKPANMMLDSRGRLKLADFGIAAQVSDSVSRVSVQRHGQSGTITYMSPQQMDGRLPQVSDDIYALGATLYELLASKPPFFTGDIAHQVRHLTPQPLHDRLAELEVENAVPPYVAALIMACLQKDPALRPASARAVAEWIGLPPLAAGVRTTAGEPAPEQVPTTAASSTHEIVATKEPHTTFPEEAFTEAPVEEPPVRRRRAILFAAVAGGLVLGAVLAPLAAKKFRRAPAGAKLSNEQSQPATPATTSARTGDSSADTEFISLFNGRDLGGWSGNRDVWYVQDGAIRSKTGKLPSRQSACLFWSGEELRDFELRLQFRLWGGNSGVFYRATPLPGGAGGYQFDIAPRITGNLIEDGNDRPRRDLFRVDSGAAREQWANFDPRFGWHEVVIRAEGNRLIHQLDGVTVCDITDDAARAPRAGALALEAMSDTIVEFKDVRLKRLAPTARAGATGPWLTLFNGNSLGAWEGWKGQSWLGAWSILNDELHSLPGSRVDLATREQFGDFELEFEWKVSPGANSGVLYRAVPSGAVVWKTAPEYQIVDDARHADGRDPLHRTASLYGVIGPALGSLKPAGEFNHGRIVVRGRQGEHWLNGKLVLAFDLSDTYVQRKSFTKFQAATWGEAPRGHIVLQHMSNEVAFRNIRVRRLD